MIFNLGDNPTLDVIRMLLHYSLQQNKPAVEQHPLLPNVVENAQGGQLLNNTSPAGESEHTRRLHVTNLPFKIKDHELRRYFEEFGAVQDAEIIYNERGSKGFGFVTMVTEEDATKAKDALHGKEIEGRKIEINLATPKSTTTKSRSKPRSHTQTNANRTTNRVGVATAYPQQRKQSASTMSYQMAAAPTAIAPPPNIMIPPITPHTAYQYYPTPEQYAQYYQYLTSQGALQQPYQNTTNANYRYQPY